MNSSARTTRSRKRIYLHFVIWQMAGHVRLAITVIRIAMSFARTCDLRRFREQRNSGGGGEEGEGRGKRRRKESAAFLFTCRARDDASSSLFNIPLENWNVSCFLILLVRRVYVFTSRDKQVDNIMYVRRSFRSKRDGKILWNIHDSARDLQCLSRWRENTRRSHIDDFTR